MPLALSKTSSCNMSWCGKSISCHTVTKIFNYILKYRWCSCTHIPSLLKKCGFINDEMEYYDIRYTLGTITVEITEIGSFQWLENNSRINHPEIRFLHQFQNLYFSLT